MSDRSHLEEISIRGLGIIDHSILEFSPGLNVLTGETGAGNISGEPFAQLESGPDSIRAYFDAPGSSSAGLITSVSSFSGTTTIFVKPAA